jgi:hypothetical protein
MFCAGIGPDVLENSAGIASFPADIAAPENAVYQLPPALARQRFAAPVSDGIPADGRLRHAV